MQSPSHLFPQVPGGFDPGGKHLTKEVFETDDCGLQSLPGSKQATGLDQIGRRIQTAMDLRPLVEIRFQPSHMDRSIGQPVGWQNRDGMSATRTEKTLDTKGAAVLRADGIARV